MDDEGQELAARLVARFSQGKNAEQVEVEVTDLAGNSRTLTVAPLKPDEIPEEWYI